MGKEEIAPAISSFPTMFSKAMLLLMCQNEYLIMEFRLTIAIIVPFCL